MFKFTASLSEGARSHLLKVYTLLTVGVLTASAGCYVDIHFLRIGGLATAVGGALVFALARSSIGGSDLGSLLFLLACGMEGTALSPLVHTAMVYYPQALITAFLTTLAAFISFTFAALMAKRREYMFLSGIVASVTSCLAIASLTNIFLKSQYVMDVQVYVGLGVFLCYILLDTQMMIERFESGMNRNNFVRPACDLFGDLVAVFVRILIILMRKSEKRRTSFSPERKYYKRRSE